MLCASFGTTRKVGDLWLSGAHYRTEERDPLRGGAVVALMAFAASNNTSFLNARRIGKCPRQCQSQPINLVREPQWALVLDIGWLRESLPSAGLIN